MRKIFTLRKTWSANTDIFICLISLVMLFVNATYLWDVEKPKCEWYIYLYSWIGWFILIFVFASWKKISGKFLTPYTIFFVIMALFNYGQFYMWSLGIHYRGELGTSKFIRYMDDITLLRIQMIVCVDFLAFHLGALLVGNLTKKYSWKKKINYNKETFMISLKYTCIMIAIISTTIIYYNSIRNLIIASQYGYTSLYYGTYISVNSITKYLTYMFFPSLMGVWIGCNYSKKSFYAITLIFIPYLFINLVSGDRGSWVYYILIFFWCYLNYIKTTKLKSLIKIFVICFALLLSTSVFVKFRDSSNVDITYNEASAVVKDSSYVFVKPVFEMGQSARVLGILVQDNLDRHWSYGNTYTAALLSMVIPRVKTWFGYPDFYIENWISQKYLGVKNYGIGFSITAEAYLNGGFVFSPIIMFVIGIFFCILFHIDIKVNDPKKLFISLSSLSTLAYIARGSFELYLRMWFFGTIMLLVFAKLVYEFLIKGRVKEALLEANDVS